MAKLRKMLGSADAPYIVSLMRIIETQSKTTIANWCVSYAEVNILPIFERDYPNDKRLRDGINAAHDFLNGKIKLADAKKIIKEANGVAKEVEKDPVAQAAARAVAVASSSIHTPTNSLGFAFYAAAAVAYDSVGIEETPELYDQIAAEECRKYEAALRDIAVDNEENPAKINWNC